MLKRWLLFWRKFIKVSKECHKNVETKSVYCFLQRDFGRKSVKSKLWKRFSTQGENYTKRGTRYTDFHDVVIKNIYTKWPLNRISHHKYYNIITFMLLESRYRDACYDSFFMRVLTNSTFWFWLYVVWKLPNDFLSLRSKVTRLWVILWLEIHGKVLFCKKYPGFSSLSDFSET